MSPNEGIGKHLYEDKGIRLETATKWQKPHIQLYLDAKAARAAGIHRRSPLSKAGHFISENKEIIITSSLLLIPVAGPALAGTYGAYTLSEKEKKEREKFTSSGEYIWEEGGETTEINVKLIAGVVIAGVVIYSVVKS